MNMSKCHAEERGTPKNNGQYIQFLWLTTQKLGSQCESRFTHLIKRSRKKSYLCIWKRSC